MSHFKFSGGHDTTTLVHMTAEVRLTSPVRVFPQHPGSGVLSRAVVTDIISVSTGYLAVGSTL